MTGKPTISLAASAPATEHEQVGDGPGTAGAVCSSEVTPRAGKHPFLAGERASDRWRGRRARVRTGFGP